MLDTAKGKTMSRGLYLLLAIMVVSGALLARNALAAPPPPPQTTSLFLDRWAELDQPVQTGQAHRTWVWANIIDGPPARWEPYAQAPELPTTEGHYRAVLYFDKGRMEDNSWRWSQPPWNVTSGLLVKELMTGQMQVGDAQFEQRNPARIPVAGDPDSTITPTYATLAPLMTYKPIPSGWTVTQTLSADGAVANDPVKMRFGVTAVNAGAPSNHAVASVFWDFMNSSGTLYDPQIQTSYQGRLFENPFYATGYPLTEACWTKARVGGVLKDVLLQCFERRCLTFTPDNPVGWKVEFGNVGQHYDEWRSGTRPSWE